ncbi:MAG: signal peptidase I [Lachnospiraceae bacterium]|nr:signal peptidase I [Lachnospiraceae bacterium]
MNNSPEGHKADKRGGKLLPALCNIFGILILLSVIFLYLPVTVAKLRGKEVYNVVSGSMAPEIPVGSVIYVEPAAPETIAEEEVIAFYSGSTVIAHRVVKNRAGEGEFITKGDANEENDMNPVKYAELVGRVSWHCPVMGGLLEVSTSAVGKVYIVCFAACGAMLNILAGRLRANR